MRRRAFLAALASVNGFTRTGDRVWLPPFGPPTRIVVYHHGAGETAANLTADLRKAPMVDLLRPHGCAVVAISPGDNWGHPRAIAAYRRLYASLPPSVDRIVLAQSIGGLSGLWCGATGIVRPVAVVGIVPVCDLDAMLAGQYRAAIEQAYRDGAPAQNPIRLDVRRFVGPRYRCYASPEDVTVPADRHSLALTARLCAVGIDASVADSTHRDHSFQRIVITRSRHRDRSDHGAVIGAQRR